MGELKTRPVPLLVFVAILFFLSVSVPSLADVNLTISSQNEKTIKVIDVGNNTVLGTINQSESVVLPYVNSIVKVTTGNTMTMPNLKGALLSAHQKDVIMFFIIFMLLVIAYAILWM